MNHMQTIISDICKEKDIEYSLVSKDWIVILKKQDKIRYIAGYKFGLNDHSVGEICDDKYAFYDVVRQFNLPVTNHLILFKNYIKDEVLKYASQYGLNMVVKINTGTCGNGMYHVNNEEDLFSSIDKLLSKHFSISLSPYYDIKHEYRTVILNGEAQLIYGKIKPVVIGNGKSTIYELLCEFNPHYFKYLDDKEDLKRVLDKDEEYEYNWQFNLSKGSLPFLMENKKLEEKIKKLALKTAEILNLKFASVDVIETKDSQLLLLEANSGVMMENFIDIINNGYDIAKAIYTKAVEEMFK